MGCVNQLNRGHQRKNVRCTCFALLVPQLQPPKRNPVPSAKLQTLVNASSTVKRQQHSDFDKANEKFEITQNLLLVMCIQLI
jgi:hypothetical protein